MPIAVTCQCGAKFAAKDELAGKAVKCPKCSQPLKIPTADKASPVAKTATGASATKSAPQAAPSQAAAGPLDSLWDEIGLTGSKTGVTCPNCKADMQPGAVICVACGFNTQTKKQLTTYSDADAKRRREEIERKQRAAVERSGKPRSSSGSSSSYDADSAGLPWLREGGTIGSVWDTAKMIWFNPGGAFIDLPPTGGTFTAICFPAMATCFVVLVYGFLYFGLLVMAALRVSMSPEANANTSQNIAMVLALTLVGVLIQAGIASLFSLIFQPVVGLIISGIAYPIVKYGGHTEREFGAVFRVTMYVIGAMLVLAAIPCVGPLIAFVHFFFAYALGLKYHLRIETGIAAVASIVGICAYYAFVVLCYLIVLIPIIALAALANQAR